MLDSPHRLELSAKDMDLLESALQTQQKILSVQSQAGGSGAVHKLADLQRLMKRVGRARAARSNGSRFSLLQVLREYFCSMRGCSDSR